MGIDSGSCAPNIRSFLNIRLRLAILQITDKFLRFEVNPDGILHKLGAGHESIRLHFRGEVSDLSLDPIASPGNKYMD